MRDSWARPCHTSAFTTIVLTALMLGCLVRPSFAQTDPKVVYFKGTVYLADNSVAARVLVTVYSRGRFLAVETDKKGHFQVANREALLPLTVRVYADGHQVYTRTFQQFQSYEEEIRLVRLPGP